MSSQTPNLNLVLPVGTEKVSRQIINDNNTKIDTAVGSNSQAIANVQNGLAYIVGNTNTTGATLAVGQFVYVKGHSTIAEGLRKVTASISANGNITTSNTSACSEGGLNALNSNATPMQFDLTNVHSAVTDRSRLRSYKVGRFVVINGYFTINASLANGTTLFRSPYKPLWLQVGHLDRSGYEGKYFPIYCIDTTGDVITNCGTLSADTYDINMIFVCQ